MPPLQRRGYVGTQELSPALGLRGRPRTGANCLNGKGRGGSRLLPPLSVLRLWVTCQDKPP